MSFQQRGRRRGRGYYRDTNMKRKEANCCASAEICTTESLRSDETNSNDDLSNVISVNLTLDTARESWFSNLRSLWNTYKKCPVVSNTFYQYMDQCENPYEEALRFMYNCLDFKNAKPKSLSYFIMEELQNWCNMQIKKPEHLLTVDLKVSAFNIVRQQSLFSLMKLVATVYEMAKDCDMFLGIIKHMIELKQYKEACQSTILLGLHCRFGIEDFLIPLILQDKLVCVDDFLMESPKHQTELVTFLDSVLGQNVSIRNALDSLIVKLNVPEVKWEKLHYKPWRKLISRLVKMFHLPSNISPNLNKKRNEGALQFLLHKRYSDNTFGDESWKEMVQEAVQDDEKLQQELIIQLSVYGDPAEALRWAIFYGISRDYWPQAVKMLHDNPDKDRHQQSLHNYAEEENWDDLTDNTEPIVYHKLDLPLSSVHLIDDIPSFEHFLDTGLQNVNIVGIDCEWKPSFGLQKNELALMQIATRKAVFILDIIKLGSNVPHLWQELGKFLFNDCDTLKLGFGLTADFSMIRHALPHMNFCQKQVGFLDLLSVWKQLERYPKVKLPFEVNSGGPGLSTLVHLCLGHPLDKSDQFSNWEKRPLRESQLVYAALDAYCLIEVYDVLKTCCEKGGFPFEETCYNLMTSSKMPKKKTKKKKIIQKSPSLAEENNLEQPPSPHDKEITPKELQVVCDTMLQGLGKNLRRCGIDTVILENFEDHLQCVRLAQDERRYILTRGNVFNMLARYVPAGFCLKIISDDVDEQLKEVINYYKVVITKDYVFSRCEMCNSDSFIKISKSTMNTIAENYNSQKVFYSPPPPPTYDLADEASGFSSDEDYFLENDSKPIHSRKWDLCSDENVDVGLCLTSHGAKIQVNTIPVAVLQKIDLFYVCEACGKVYWDGSHFEKILSGRLQGIVL